IRRSGGSAAMAALDSAAEVLEDGHLFGIYPEGTRSPDGRLYKGHTGIARLALQTKTPIIPVAMIGTREAQPIGQVKPNFFSPITVRFGRPLAYDQSSAQADDRMVLRNITDEVMFELRELSGQDYVNQYAKRKDTVDDAVAAPAKVFATA
ncbi:MAG: 1-acyl-sn-glycerol-3-phosphate acyltransferase, partial [Actinomycetota bacterium]